MKNNLISFFIDSSSTVAASSANALSTLPFSASLFVAMCFIFFKLNEEN